MMCARPSPYRPTSKVTRSSAAEATPGPPLARKPASSSSMREPTSGTPLTSPRSEGRGFSALAGQGSCFIDGRLPAPMCGAVSHHLRRPRRQARPPVVPSPRSRPGRGLCRTARMPIRGCSAAWSRPGVRRPSTFCCSGRTGRPRPRSGRTSPPRTPAAAGTRPMPRLRSRGPGSGCGSCSAQHQFTPVSTRQALGHQCARHQCARHQCATRQCATRQCARPARTGQPPGTGVTHWIPRLPTILVIGSQACLLGQPERPAALRLQVREHEQLGPQDVRQPRRGR